MSVRRADPYAEMEPMVSNTDWDSWHDRYSDSSSMLSERLRLVQQRISDWLDDTAPTPVTVLSSCAGDGRDLLEVLSGRTDAQRVTATLIDANVANVSRAKDHIDRLKLERVEARCADAGASDAYIETVPADLVMLCGIFGNLADEDVTRTIAAAPQLCSRNATVIWTRSRSNPDPIPGIRECFQEHEFIEEHFDATDDSIYTVGVHRFAGTPTPLIPGQRLFTFIT